MHQRLHALLAALVVLLTIIGWASASMRPFAAPARAQVVTPDPSPPSFANQQLVIVSDNITTRENPHTFATGELADPSAYPVTTVRVRNHQGDLNEQRFWLSVRIQQQDAGVEVTPEPGYAQMGLIAPGGEAAYTVTFPGTPSARVEFEVDGSTDEAVMLTLLQFALDAGFTAADLTGLGGHDAEIGRDLADVVADQYLADLPTLVPCANAVAAVQRGLDDKEQFERDLQGCLESPIWQASVDQVLARVAERDWFQQSLNLAGKAVPQVGAALKTVEAGQFAAQLWTMYDKFHPEVPGAMAGTVAFLSVDTNPPETPGTATAAPELSGQEEVGLSGPTGEFVVAWSLAVPGHEQGLDGVVSGNTVFVGDENGVVRAVDVTNGQVRWQSEIGNSRQTVVAAFDDLVFVIDEITYTAHRLVALDQATGEARWEFSPATQVLGASSDMLFIDSDYHTTHAIDAMTGTELWRYPTEGAIFSLPGGRNSGATPTTLCAWYYCVDTLNGQERVRYLGPEAQVRSATVAGDTIFTVSPDDRMLQALDAETGVEKWRTQFDAEQMPLQIGFVENGVAYGVSGKGTVQDPSATGFFAVDAASGELLWNVDTFPWEDDFPYASQQPDLAGMAEGVLIGLRVYTLVALNALTGEELWHGPDIVFNSLPPLLITEGAIYASESEGSVSRLDVLTGQARSTLQVANGPFALLGIADGKVIGRSETELIAISGTGEPDPTPTPTPLTPGTTLILAQETMLFGAPSQQSVVVAELAAGTEVLLLEEATAGDGSRWWYVEVAESGATGFISEESFRNLTASKVAAVSVV